jgi:hypothetical protein
MTSIGKPMRVSLDKFEQEIREEREALPSYCNITKSSEVQQEQNFRQYKEDEFLENSFCDLQKQMEQFQNMEDSTSQVMDQLTKTNSHNEFSQGKIFEEFESLNARCDNIFVVCWK